jgi:hypothetical protein
MECPQCKQVIDNVMAVEQGSKPKENDLIICTMCYGINTFDKDLNLVKASNDYVESIPESMRFEIDEFVKDLKLRRAEDNAKLN